MLRALLLLLAFGIGVEAQAGAKKMNLLFIVTDDQAVWSLGSYGNTDAKTPNLDRLDREGARFKNARVATPVCSPSRGSLFSGRYGTQLKITDWITPQESKMGHGLPTDVQIWPQVLQRAGYATGLIGKWHLGELPRFHPMQRGFDFFLGFLTGGNTPMNPTLEVAGETKQLQGSLPDLLTDSALDFVRKNKDRPFALTLTFREPHAPYAPTPAEDAAPFENLDPKIPNFPGLNEKQVKKLTREYYASIHSVDRNVGRLVAELDRLGLLENTIIVFTSDHGYMIGQHGLIHKGNATWLVGPNQGVQRANMYDLSLRVPLLIRWPGTVRPGLLVDEPVCNIDTFASVLGMLAVPAPADYKQEGRDFSPILRGQKIAWRDAHFSQYDVHNGLGKKSDSLEDAPIVTSDWHLVRQYNQNHPDELFDLTRDPDELTNLYADPAHRATRDGLQARLDAWMRSIDDPLKAN